jgi:catechol 2,3-dioxygenase-like lactoylglutathione lyase family enzyme
VKVDVGHGDADSDMPFAYERMADEPLAPEKFPAEIAVTDIRMISVTAYLRFVCQEDPDIVKQRRFFDERLVGSEMTHAQRHLKRLCGHGPAVADQHGKGCRAGAIVFLYDPNQVHFRVSFSRLPFDTLFYKKSPTAKTERRKGGRGFAIMRYAVHDCYTTGCISSDYGGRGTVVKYNGVNHLAMATGDIDCTIRFWRDLLGMRLVAGLGAPGYRHYFFEISEKDTIAFFEWPGVEPVDEKEHGRVVSGSFVFDHVSFGVVEKEDLWELKDRISAAGFWVSEVIDHGFILSIYTFDPNGIPIEFSWNVEEIDIHERPVMADPFPSAAADEGPEPRRLRWPAIGEPERERRIYPGQGREFFHRMKKEEE